MRISVARALLFVAAAACFAACATSSSTAPPAPRGASGIARDLSATGTAYASAVASDAPFAWYRLGDTGSIAADATGNGHNGVVSASGVRHGATPLLTGDATNATRFFGNAAGEIGAPQSAAFEPPSGITVELWARIAPVIPRVDEGLVMYGVSAQAPYTGYGLKYNYDRVLFKLALPGGIVRLAPSSGLGVTPAAGSVHHVVATYDGTTANLYVDAQLVASQAATGAIAYDPAHQLGLVLGNNQSGTTPAWAALQDVALYARALAPAAIARHYAIGTSGSAPTPTPTPVPAPTADPRLVVPRGFTVAKIAAVGNARELVAAPNGDLLVGTLAPQVWVVPGAEGAGAAGNPQVLITLPEGPAQGIALGPNHTLYVATNTAVWKIPYTPGDLSEPAGSAVKIASVRTGAVAPNSDGDVHNTSSVAVTATTVYVGVGSSCNACVEVDPTRATIQQMGLNGENQTTLARRMRNPIGLAIDPSSGALWAGGAGQDSLAAGHPYEYFDPVTAHGAAPVDYGWPACEENQHAYVAGSTCTQTVAPAVEFPAYSTIIGVAFYPLAPAGAYAFPAAYRGGAFVSMHGSWHSSGGKPVAPPHVAFVPMTGGAPATAVNWNDPTAQWTDFFTGFQDATGARIGRTTGVAAGAQGSLFVAEGQAGNIYRIRPAGP